MSRPTFMANACMPETRRTCGGEVFVEVTHWPSSTTYMLTASEARAWAVRLLAAASAISLPREYVFLAGDSDPDVEPTRKQCSKCLKDCAECKCVGNRARKGT